MANRIPIYSSGYEGCQGYSKSCPRNTCKCDGSVVVVDCDGCDKESDSGCAQSNSKSCNIFFCGSSDKPDGCSTCNAACNKDGELPPREHWCYNCDFQCKEDGPEPCTSCDKSCNGCDGCDSCDGCNTRSQTCDCYSTCYGQARGCTQGCNQGCYQQARPCGCYSPSCYEEARNCACYQLRYNYVPCQVCDVCDQFVACTTCDVACDGDACSQCHHASYSQPW